MARILVVDDREDNRYLLRQMLAGWGHQVEEATNGIEALQAARASRPDLVLSDLFMPGMDGYTLLRNWKSDERLRAIPFVVYTATYTEPRDEQLALDLGADAFLVKPVEPAAFAERLHAILDRPATEPRTAVEADRLQEYTAVLAHRLEARTARLAESRLELERQKASLRESQSRLELALRAAQLGPWDWDMRTNQAYLSPEWKRQIGYEDHEVANHYSEWESRLHPMDREPVLAALKAFIAGERPDYEVEFRLRHKDGSYRWIATRGEIVRDAQGRPLRMLGCHLDITARRQREETLRKLSAAVEQSPAGVLITDLDGCIEYVNPHYASMTGYPPEELLGQNPRIFKSGQTPESVYKDLWETLTAGKEFRHEFLNRRKDGSFYWSQSAISCLRDATGVITHYMAVTEDVTERRALEAQFQQAQKLEAIGRLAGGVAHDFNNMLSVILGYAEVAMMDLDPEDPMHETLGSIQEAARRSAELTRQLLAFSRRQTIQPRQMNLNHQLDSISTLLHRLLGEDVRLRIEPGSELWPVRMDPSQLDQILANLSVNARDAMPKGGTLTFSTLNTTLDESFCRDRVGVVPGDYVCLSACDTGCGMAPEVLKHIFEPFFTTKAAGKGTGLGLATVYGVVHQNGGHIEVKTMPGEGTTFRLYLPRAEQKDRPAPTGSADASLAGWETVLVVEDDPGVRNVTCRLLQRLGYRVLSAASPSQALTLWEDLSEPVHLLLTDVILPEMTGRELSERIRAARPDLKVLYMSGYPADAITDRGVLQPGIQFLEKPFTMNRLGTRVREVLEGSGDQPV